MRTGEPTRCAVCGQVDYEDDSEREFTIVFDTGEIVDAHPDDVPLVWKDGVRCATCKGHSDDEERAAFVLHGEGAFQ